MKIFNILDLIYPPFCLHCAIKLPTFKLLCPSCLELLSLLKPWEMGDMSNQNRLHHAAVFDNIGPAVSLLQEARQSRNRKVISVMAALMVCQWHELGRELPDLVVPLPNSKLNFALAKQVAKLLHRPYKVLLGYSFWPPLFFLRKKEQWLVDKTILVIGEQLNCKLKRGARVAYQSDVEAVYALAWLKDK